MSETSNEIETTTNDEPSLLKALGTTAAISAVGVAATFGTMIAMGGVLNLVEKYRNKRAAKKAQPES